jgi:hypothetical protein
MSIDSQEDSSNGGSSSRSLSTAVSEHFKSLEDFPQWEEHPFHDEVEINSDMFSDIGSVFSDHYIEEEEKDEREYDPEEEGEYEGQGGEEYHEGMSFGDYQRMLVTGMHEDEQFVSLYSGKEDEEMEQDLFTQYSQRLRQNCDC